MKKKPSKLFTYSILSLLVGVFLAYLVRGSIILLVVTTVFFWFGFVPAFLGALICKTIRMMFRKKENMLITSLHSAFKIIMAVVIIQVIAGYAGYAFWSVDVEKAQTFCEELVTMIEEEKEKTGAYPSDIKALLQCRGKLPRFVDRLRLYHRRDAGYELSFIATGGFFPRSFRYSSEKKEWEMLG